MKKSLVEGAHDVKQKIVRNGKAPIKFLPQANI